MQNAQLTDVMVHLDEPLDEDAFHALEQDIRQDAGVISIGQNPGRPNLLMVVYDSEVAHAETLLHRLHARGLHAQLIGL